jgi:translation initiation factor IF-2
MMGKKRIHEIAKELGVDSKELLNKLLAAGLAVKTHSSTVYEEEVRAVLDREKTHEATPAVRRPGMMIVKKREEAPVVPVAPPQVHPEVDEQVEEVVEAEAPAYEAPDVEPVSQPIEAPFVEQENARESSLSEASDETSVIKEEEVQHTASEPPPVESQFHPTMSSEPPAAQTPSTHVAAPKSAPQTFAKRPPQQATVVRMIDREKLMERLPPRRHPQGTQGVNRPGNAAPRPTTPAQKFGKVTEIKVVNDPYGRGREMVAVGRDKDKRAPGGGKGPMPAAGPMPAQTLGKVGKKERGGAKRGGMENRRERNVPARLKRKKTGPQLLKRPEMTQPKASKRVVRMKEKIVITDFAHQLGVKASDVIRKLMASLNMMVAQNQTIDFDAAQLIAGEYGFTVESTAFAESEHLQPQVSAEETLLHEELKSRPPVVTVMGHVDHGKTSLLDAIRKTRVAVGEAGGITQHIGAYSVTVPDKGMVTFLDTPGHAAFTNMRARGAKATDIVVLVVAADDGVMPQTEEAIKHAKAANVPIIVAVNKIDKPEANPDRVLQELIKFELMPEAWGGQTLFVNTSATKGTGITELLETILLQAEVLELKANPARRASGVVIEAQLDKGRGPVATILVQNGTLNQGDYVVVGEFAGKVRAMVDSTGKQLKSAGPSFAVEITGLEGVPLAGDTVNAVENADAAHEVAQHRSEAKKTFEQSNVTRMSLDDLMKRMQNGENLELKVVLKADVQGSAEAVKDAIMRLTTDEVKLSVIYDGVGAINESDVMLAAASGGLVVGFNVRPDNNARTIAERQGVEVRTYTIIYNLVDDVRKAMEGLLSPELREKIVGHAEVREVFKLTKVGVIAGSKVLDGKAVRAGRVRLLRDGVQVYDGKVASLKHFKSDVREVETGLECGIGVENFNDIKQGDKFEFYQIEEIERTLQSPPNKKNQRPGNEARA